MCSKVFWVQPKNKVLSFGSDDSLGQIAFGITYSLANRLKAAIYFLIRAK